MGFSIFSLIEWQFEVAFLAATPINDIDCDFYLFNREVLKQTRTCAKYHSL